METDERCVEEKCKDAQNIPFTFRLRLCSSLLIGTGLVVFFLLFLAYPSVSLSAHPARRTVGNKG